MDELQRLKEEKWKIEKKADSMRSTLRDLYGIVKNSLITLDWTIKLGSVAGCWWFPLPQERLAQVIAVASLLVLTTIVSKGIRSMKAIEAKLNETSVY
jgi:hypothetical protein